jgi:hypothetical protein
MKVRWVDRDKNHLRFSSKLRVCRSILQLKYSCLYLIDVRSIFDAYCIDEIQTCSVSLPSLNCLKESWPASDNVLVSASHSLILVFQCDDLGVFSSERLAPMISFHNLTHYDNCHTCIQKSNVC